jgi:hypothetical protein
VVLPARELFQRSNSSLWMVDRCLLLVLARQDISKTSATAPADLSCQSISVERIHTLNRHPHKHVVGRTRVVLNTESDPHSGQRNSGGSERSLLSRRKRDSDLGEIAGPVLLRRPTRDRRTEKSCDGGGDGGDSDHFLRLNQMKGLNGQLSVLRGGYERV